MSDGQHSPHDPAHLLALNAALRAENENLKAVVETLRRALYGARSERQLEPANQLPLALNDLSAAPVEPAKLLGCKQVHGIGVVTAPIHKESLNLSGAKFPGHTEIFTALTNAKRSCMMLYSDKLTVSMATTHIGYAEVCKKLSVERVLNVIELTAQTMKQLLRRAPRIGVCGLNPHAGEHGLFGNHEEEKFVGPAVKLARKRKLNVTGPLVPDAVFTNGQRKNYDAIVTLYHDQGHIPFKMLAFDTGVNITLGLPIIRTSVDHGTAFDIAWQGKADATSLFSAIRVAAQLAQNKISGLRYPVDEGRGGTRVHRKS